MAPPITHGISQVGYWTDLIQPFDCIGLQDVDLQCLVPVPNLAAGKPVRIQFLTDLDVFVRLLVLDKPAALCKIHSLAIPPIWPRDQRSQVSLVVQPGS